MLKIYQNGEDFIVENKDIFRKYPLETIFFEANAKFMPQTDKNNFLLKLTEEDKFLLVVHNGDYPMVIFGNNELCRELASHAVALQLTFNKVMGSLTTCETFLAEYEGLTNTNHRILHAMDIMQCNRLLTENFSSVEMPTERDIDEIAALMQNFHNDALGETVSFRDKQKEVKLSLNDFVIIRRGDSIVAFACKKRETDYLACISNVYTRPQYRGMGLACRVVSFLTKQILESGKLPYLFVDKSNPISNHLYCKIGYTYAVPQYQIEIV